MPTKGSSGSLLLCDIYVIKIGTLVKRSARWKEQFPQRVSTLRGMVVGHQSSWEGQEWPMIWWEGYGLAVPEYPDHVEPLE